MFINEDKDITFNIGIDISNVLLKCEFEKQIKLRKFRFYHLREKLEMILILLTESICRALAYKPNEAFQSA